MNLRSSVVAAMAVAALMVSPASAKHYRHSGGACDGIHRCICGSTQTAHFGLPRMYNGHNLWQAVEWTKAFPHTSIHVGAVGYQHGGGPTGHVFRVAAYAGGCRATVTDEKGTYDRDVCGRGAVFVDVTGSGFAAGAQTTTYSAKKHRRHRHERFASVHVGGSFGPASFNFGAGI